MASVHPQILEWRRQGGLDQFDEMWDGVLHMVPVPNRIHQDLEFGLEAWLRRHWAASGAGRVYHQINVASVGGWRNNYRIPDLVLLTPDRYGIDHNEYFEGGPTVVIEIVSPGDESYEKLDFYAQIGVDEVWMIARDSKAPEIRTRSDGRWSLVPPTPEGWHVSQKTTVHLRATQGKGVLSPPEGQLEIRLGSDPATFEVLSPQA